MPTLSQRISKYLGSVSEPSGTDIFLANAVNTLYTAIPASKAQEFLTPTGLESPATYPTGRVFALTNDAGYPLKEIGTTEYAKHVDVNSIYYAGSRDPVFWNDYGTLKTSPSPLSFSALKVDLKDSIASSLSTIPEFPNGLLECVAIDAATKILATKVATSFIGIGKPVPPTPIAMTSPTFSDLPEFKTLAALPVPTFNVPEYEGFNIDWLDNATTNIRTDEDFEKALTELKLAETGFGRWAKEVENLFISFKNELELFSAEFTAAMKDQEATMVMDKSKIDYYMAQATAWSKEMETASLNYRSEVESYTAQMQAYTADLQTKIQLHMALVKDLMGIYKEIFEAYVA